ncbi:Bug family tripartite tricarboxylate transporter substrate binding protein [Billgrantia endophytica]|uniref:Tripartite tricarboxylate transporter substrate binding protein n=1 Tax=Billgrantia endophytica TaxID=2033802 RepID=A0A2N7UBX0_9GAMM|nr:tripartite tricarboxylate transporter substrate binding protein [Halomonas endophytica]PMR77891.1 tripartite tricarboxylate transporter substrate binding protein [Halomonas endophytica]
MPRTFFKTIVTVSFAVLFTSSIALAQDDFPSQEIRIIVPWNPGGSTDIMARKILPSLEEQGVRAVVENMPGGGSAVGMAQVASAAPDGYTVGLGSSSILSLIAQGNVPFTYDSFTDIALFSEDPLVLLVSPNSEWDSLNAFMEYMKENPGSVTIGTPGTNNVNHAMAGLTGQAAGVEFRHIPYPGGSRVIAEIMGGQIDAGVLKPSETLPQIEADDLQAIGVYRQERIEALPETETFQEAGYDVFSSGELAQITYLTAPAGLDAEIRERLVEIFNTAILSEAFQEFAEENGFIAGGLSGEELQEYNAGLIDTLESAAQEIFTGD